jgi:hypothetical protein
MTKEMAEVETRDIALNWDVLVTPGVPAAIFDRVTGTTTTAPGLYDKILVLDSDRVNPGGALWLSACAVKP